jgi:hypothetical protein
MKKTMLGFALMIISFGSIHAASAPEDNPVIAVHNILSTELPWSLLKNLNVEYKNYWITDLYQQENNKKTVYFITVENADQFVKLSCDNKTNWVVESTTAKN